ncbi:MAG: FadR/GntR family transcriptional regulator [Mycobacteriales bacterium]
MTSPMRRAEEVARQLTEEIREQGWKVGDSLGSEAQLMARLGVGRNVLREALRLLAQDGVATMRTGRAGGLYVTSPGPTPVARVLEHYMTAHGVGFEHVLEAKRSIELTCVRLACERLDAAGEARLRAAIEYERTVPVAESGEVADLNIHVLLAELTGNPAMHVFVEALTRLSLDFVGDVDLQATAPPTHLEHIALCEAVLARDPDKAVAIMDAHLSVVGDSMAACSG